MNRRYPFLVLAVLLFAASAGAAEPAAVADLRDGTVPEETVVTLENALVTAVQNSSFTISDQLWRMPKRSLRLAAILTCQTPFRFLPL